MSAKFLQALTDENPDLQKQVGCMTGIFQVFDRHHILTGKRLNGHSHKRLPQGRSHMNSGTFGVEPLASSPYAETEKVSTKNPNENQRNSMESSRASFSSSSCSSSFSSLDCNKTTQPEAPLFEQSAYLERSLRSSQKLQNSSFDSTSKSYALSRDQVNASVQSGRQSLDIRDIVKDSIYRETHGLSVKTPSREETANHFLKHRDSQRSVQLSKSLDGSSAVGANGKPRMAMDLNESLKVLAKLQEVPWYFNEVREPSRSSCESKDVSSYSTPKDTPRYSYDGREIHRSSFDSRDSSKSGTKLRELPRLSLDSREGSMKSSNFGTKSSMDLKDLRRINSEQKMSSDGALYLHEMGSYNRPPSVVAKLMGLQAIPNSTSAAQEQIGQTHIGKDCDMLSGDRNSKTSRLSTSIEENKQQTNLWSPKNSPKEAVSPQLRNSDSVMEPIPGSRFPIEPAPWRQPDSGRTIRRTPLRIREAHPSSPTSQSIYNEIEKRLKELEFQQSNKELRALKQILDVMQAKGLLKSKKGDQVSDSSVQNDFGDRDQTVPGQNLRSKNRRNPSNIHQVSAPFKGSSSRRAFESPIVIMKPAKFIDRSSIPASSVIPLESLSGLRKSRTSDSVDSKKVLVSNRIAKNVTPRLGPREPANRTLTSMDKKIGVRGDENSSQKPRLRSLQSPCRTQCKPRENSGSPAWGSGSLSPRMQQKKLELEKRSRPPVPTSDSSKPRRQSVRQQPESGSPGGKRRAKSANMQQVDDQSSDISSGTREMSHHGDEISLRSDSNVSLASQVDVEVTSADCSAEINFAFFQQGCESPSVKVTNNTVSNLKQKSPSFSEDGLAEEFTTAGPEQPSPVSVLDALFYRDDLLPSPVKKISRDFKGNETLDPNNISGEDEWKTEGLGRFSGSTSPCISSEINHKKLENIECLVQKLRRLNSAHNEVTTDYIASLCENKNPDHRYVSEILLASGLLLKDLTSSPTSIQLYPSDPPLNPDLFFVLEQTRASWHPASKFVDVLQSKPENNKLHRKLVFDTVNEILTRKLISRVPKPWLRPDRLTGASPSGQQLLRELCSEIDKLRAHGTDGSLDEDDDGLCPVLREDMMHHEESWTDFRKDVSGMVLDIERLVFKDLIDEIVNGESASQVKPCRRRRQLFDK